MREEIKLMGWSWTGNHGRQLNFSHCCRFPGGNQCSLSGTTMARKQRRAPALHRTAARLTGLSLTGLFYVIATPDSSYISDPKESSTADKTGSPKSLCPPLPCLDCTTPSMCSPAVEPCGQEKKKSTEKSPNGKRMRAPGLRRCPCH